MQPKRYVLGLDIGSASLGWACIATDATGVPQALTRAGVRIFEPGVDGSLSDIQTGKDQSKAVDRRTARLQRRQLRRRTARQRELFDVLQQAGLLPNQGDGIGSKARHELLNKLDRDIGLKFTAIDVTAAGQLPLHLLRRYALDHPLESHELGRVFFRLSQRRGFLSNRKEMKKAAKQDEDLGQVKEAIRTLDAEMKSAGARTLGEFFAALDPHQQKVRRRWTARQMFKDEFALLWETQRIHHADLLTPELYDLVAHLLFFQRPIAKQGHLIGKCELESGKQSSPWSTLLAQRFRVLQKVNDLRVVAGDHEQELTPEQRATLYAWLNQEGTQTFVKVKAHLGMPRTVRFNLERGDEKNMPGNRTECSMHKVFGARWNEFTAGKQDQIVENWRNAGTDEQLRAGWMRLLSHPPGS